MTLRQAAHLTGLQITSLVTGLTMVLVGAVYLDPTLVRRPTLAPGQVSIVVFLEMLGPVWSVVFWVSGGALVAAVMARRHIIGGHIAAMAAWGFYGGAIIAGALLSKPPSTIIVAVLAFGLAATHLGLIIAHQDAGDAHGRPRRLRRRPR